ncbi:DoxX family protein [Nocardiopsis ansamitocini]|uniref:DoxX family protein n=1 Tax=Nocardiopsis ansamitocini TaxID=1670832 RepID=A0A9W6P9F5_9ACTN|nr:DoxX family protein [Nocardiopsis ansamitocini]GLU49423.1 hypothetical protein Nans01_37740 [Nocardiopsis ansamitocini]
MRHYTPTLRDSLVDITALVARIAVGVTFIAHGAQKLGMGVEGAGHMFDAIGVPFPQAAAALAIAVEIGGGAALLLGLALPVTGAVLAGFMAAAYFFGHLGAPLTGPGGFELALVLGGSALALGFAGGRLTVDRFLPWGRQAVRTSATEVSPAA